MLKATEFHDVVSGRRRGVVPGALRAVLRIAETPYTWAVNHRNRRFDKNHATSHRVAVPVISVGNLSLGGTGKTPMVKWLARWIAARGLRVAIVSRGYGAAAGQENDEALELAASLPDVPHVQNPNRVAAATRAVVELGAQVVLLDDGFQHRRLQRDLDLVLLDALEPFGFEHVFPRGTLREPVTGLRRAHIMCLSRADAVTAIQREDIRRRAMSIAPNAVWCELVHAPSRLVNSEGNSLPLERLNGQKVAAFCGIGNPTGFRHTLVSTGCNLTTWHEFPDHHAYGASDAEALARLVSAADLAICTHKDLVKLRRTDLGGVPLWAVEIEMRFLGGQQPFESKVAGTLRVP